MAANEDLERIREAITGRPGPAPFTGGAQSFPGTGKTGKPAEKGKKKGGPAPLPPGPAAVPPPAPRREESGGGSGILGGIAFLVAAAFVINGWINSGGLPGFGSATPPWSSGSSAGSGSHPDTAPEDDTYSAPEELRVSPRSGSAHTTVTVTGSGFIRDGRVKLTFHATAMGEARTDGDGDFTARMRLPSPDFYGRFPGQTFSINTTEYTRDGTYQGNGPGVGFHIN
jgi:hypothetical protein